MWEMACPKWCDCELHCKGPVRNDHSGTHTLSEQEVAKFGIFFFLINRFPKTFHSSPCMIAYYRSPVSVVLPNSQVLSLVDVSMDFG